MHILFGEVVVVVGHLFDVVTLDVPHSILPAKWNEMATQISALGWKARGNTLLKNEEFRRGRVGIQAWNHEGEGG